MRVRTPADGMRRGWAARVAMAFAIALPATFLAVPVAAQSPFPADQDLGVMIHYLVADGATPGIAFGVADLNGGRTDRVFMAGTGGPDMPTLTDQSVFELGSITKTFTGTLLALAVRKGEVSLDDPVADYLPDSVSVPSWGDRQITLLDLATHRSGLPGLPTNFLPGDLGDPYADYTIHVLYDFLSGYQLTREPGTQSEYSNLGFGLLGHALARAAGTTYPALLRARILEPLGMDHTGYASDAVYTESGMAERMTQPHSRGEAVPAWTTGAGIRGAGGLRSTMADMLKYLAANIRPPDSELGAAMRDARQARAPFDAPQVAPGTRVGLAWRLDPVPGSDRVIIEHGGSTAGSRARIAFDPDRGVGFVRLTNSGDFADANDPGIYLLQTGPPIDDPVVDVPAETLRGYAGAYRFAPGAELYIRYDDRGGWLTSQLGPTVRFRLYPTADTAFYVKRIPTRFAFRTDASGRVEAAVLNPGPRQRVMPKVSDDTPDPHLPVPEIRDLSLTADDIARYAGAYTLESESGLRLELRVRGEDGGLVGQLMGGAAFRLRYQGNDVFVPERDPASRARFQVRNGRAIGVEANFHGTVLTGQRTADEPEGAG